MSRLVGERQLPAEEFGDPPAVQYTRCSDLQDLNAQIVSALQEPGDPKSILQEVLGTISTDADVTSITERTCTHMLPVVGPPHRLPRPSRPRATQRRLAWTVFKGTRCIPCRAGHFPRRRGGVGGGGCSLSAAFRAPSLAARRHNLRIPRNARPLPSSHSSRAHRALISKACPSSVQSSGRLMSTPHAPPA